MSAQFPYSITTDVKFGPLELIDVQRLGDQCNEEWFNQTLCQVNDCVVRMGVVKGEFHWHDHEKEDEFFYVVEGKLFIDVADAKADGGERTVELTPKQGFTVPKGVRHRTRAPERTVILMIEGSTVIPTGD